MRGERDAMDRRGLLNAWAGRGAVSLTLLPERRGQFERDRLSDRRDGYGIRRWRAGGREYWAVSDVDAGSLDRFCKALREATN